MTPLDKHKEQARAWTKWSDRRPPNAPGKHRYRVRANILGMVLAPEWTADMQLCGMGYGPNEYWPSHLHHWDGYQRYVTHKGLEWSDLLDDDPAGITWTGLDLLPCPFTGKPAFIEPVGRYIGAPLWHLEAFYISSAGVPKRRWSNAAGMQAAWNQRTIPAQALADERAATEARVRRECADQADQLASAYRGKCNRSFDAGDRGSAIIERNYADALDEFAAAILASENNHAE